MAKTATININDQDILAALRGFLRSILLKDGIGAILAPQSLPMKRMVMPALVTDPALLESVDPLAPAFPMNAAKVVSKLSRKPMGTTVAVVLRPCEIRAFIELLKLKQGRLEEVVLVGIDCLGAYKNTDYFRFVGDDIGDSTRQFIQNALSGKTQIIEGVDLSPACKACEYPVPEGADLLMGILGADTSKHFMVQALTPRGEQLFDGLDLTEGDLPGQREAAVGSLVADRKAYRDRMFSETGEAVQSLEKLTSYLATCVNCYNCRVACPVCYCKECVFVTDVFNHEPSQYLKWAGRKGCIKMPTDTVFYHLTRMAHMSTACVGCGQCTNACPNDIPVMELFRTIAHRTQDAFEYVAGRSAEEDPPLSVFREDEFSDVVGIS
jgi:formate dehydrogenase subunit beta